MLDWEMTIFLLVNKMAVLAFKHAVNIYGSFI